MSQTDDTLKQDLSGLLALAQAGKLKSLDSLDAGQAPWSRLESYFEGNYPTPDTYGLDDLGCQGLTNVLMDLDKFAKLNLFVSDPANATSPSLANMQKKMSQSLLSVQAFLGDL